MAYSPSLSGGLFLGRERTIQVFVGKLAVGWRSSLRGYAFTPEVHRKLSSPHIVKLNIAPGSYDRIIFYGSNYQQTQERISPSGASCINTPQTSNFFFPGHYANIAITPQDALFTRPSRLINVPTIQQPEHPLRKEVPLCLITAEMKF